MQVGYYLGFGVTKDYQFGKLHKVKDLEKNGENNVFDLWQMAWENSKLQSDFKIKTQKRQILPDGFISVDDADKAAFVVMFPPSSQTPFKDALHSKQNAVTEAKYNEAIERILNLTEELATLAINEQGVRSELGYVLSNFHSGFKVQIQAEYDSLQLLKQNLQSKDYNDEDIIDAIDGYFSHGGLIPSEIIRIFDYISDKFENLPTAQIMQDLSIIKGYWDNNSTQSLKLDDGTSIGFTQILNAQGKAQRILFINNKMYDENIKFDENALKDENLGYLFEVFKQRESLQSFVSKNLQTNLAFDKSNLLKGLLNSADETNSLQGERV